ncbi:minor capsid protein [Enterococcus faecalis]
MDFIDCVKHAINGIGGLPLLIRKGYLGTEESLVIYPLPGSAATREYMDGAKDINLNYEIAMKSKDEKKLEGALWLISDYLDNLRDITSTDNSFTFNKLTITSKPFINNYDNQGWLVFLLNFTANITTKEEL